MRNRGQRTILVKCGSAIVSNAVAHNYSQVIDANPMIIKYRDAYANDLEARLKLTEDSCHLLYLYLLYLIPFLA